MPHNKLRLTPDQRRARDMRETRAAARAKAAVGPPAPQQVGPPISRAGSVAGVAKTRMQKLTEGLASASEGMAAQPDSFGAEHDAAVQAGAGQMAAAQRSRPGVAAGIIKNKGRRGSY